MIKIFTFPYLFGRGSGEDKWQAGYFPHSWGARDKSSQLLIPRNSCLFLPSLCCQGCWTSWHEALTFYMCWYTDICLETLKLVMVLDNLDSIGEENLVYISSQKSKSTDILPYLKFNIFFLFQIQGGFKTRIENQIHHIHKSMAISFSICSNICI